MPSLKPKPQEKKDQKKQKSLLGWLSNPVASKGTSSSLGQPRLGAVNPSVTSSSPGGVDSIFETPSTKWRTNIGAMSSAVESATYTRSSDGGRSINDTPPTSDPIDVDISSDEDIPNRQAKSVCNTHIRIYSHCKQLLCSKTLAKRKMAIEDSDEGEGGGSSVTHKKSSSAYKRPQEPGKDDDSHSSTSQIPLIVDIDLASGHAKKARMAALEDDTFIENDAHDGPISAFSQSLSKFKKSPKKKGWLLPWRSSPSLDNRFICSPSRKAVR
jgi:DNA mismatch repair protein MSH6